MAIVGAVVVRGCAAVIGRVGFVRSFATIRGSSGPVRYNPQRPGGAKPARPEESRISHPQLMWRGKRVAKEDDEWGLRKIPGEEDELRCATATRKAREQGGEGRKYENLQSESSNSKPTNAIPGLFYGDGRKFEGPLPTTTDAPFTTPEDNLFDTADAEEDIAAAKEKEAAKNYSLRLLAMAPQTAQKLRQKLIGRNVPESVIESTIVSLQRCGLQSDLEYAEAFARSRWRSSLWGPQRLKQELRRRGVCGEDIERALEKVFAGGDQGRWGMTEEASAHLWEKARAQWGRGGGGVSTEARRRRMVAWLQRRGFDWSITSQILKSLESQGRDCD